MPKQNSKLRQEVADRLRQGKLKGGYDTDVALRQAMLEAGGNGFDISLVGLRKILSGGTSPSIETWVVLARVLPDSLDYYITGISQAVDRAELTKFMSRFREIIDSTTNNENELDKKIRELTADMKPERKKKIYELIRDYSELFKND